jgi:hypothetical protein
LKGLFDKPAFFFEMHVALFQKPLKRLGELMLFKLSEKAIKCAPAFWRELMDMLIAALADFLNFAGFFSEPLLDPVDAPDISICREAIARPSGCLLVSPLTMGASMRLTKCSRSVVWHAPTR